jgi:serine/threonine protein kinase
MPFFVQNFIRKCLVEDPFKRPKSQKCPFMKDFIRKCSVDGPFKRGRNLKKFPFLLFRTYPEVLVEDPFKRPNLKNALSCSDPLCLVEDPFKRPKSQNSLFCSGLYPEVFGRALDDPFKRPEYQKCPLFIQDFIRKCLVEDPFKRPQARDLLFHPVLFEVHSLKLLAAHTLVKNSGAVQCRVF